MGKKYRKSEELVDRNKLYSVDEAFALLDKVKVAKFDETVDMALRLGIDPKNSEQMVRGAVSLPHGTGKKVRVVVFAKGEKAGEAEKAGADFVGGDDLLEKIKEGWLQFDSAISTPDMMATVSKVAKILGPRGLMPNPKSGSVTFDLAKTIKEIKAGRVEYRVDKAGIVHAPLGKVSFGAQNLKENFFTLVENVQRAKPSSAKGKYFRSLAVSTTMSPSIKIDTVVFDK